MKTITLMAWVCVVSCGLTNARANESDAADAANYTVVNEATTDAEVSQEYFNTADQMDRTAADVRATDPETAAQLSSAADHVRAEGKKSGAKKRLFKALKAIAKGAGKAAKGVGYAVEAVSAAVTVTPVLLAGDASIALFTGHSSATYDQSAYLGEVGAFIYEVHGYQVLAGANGAAAIFGGGLVGLAAVNGTCTLAEKKLPDFCANVDKINKVMFQTIPQKTGDAFGLGIRKGIAATAHGVKKAVVFVIKPFRRHRKAKPAANPSPTA